VQCEARGDGVEVAFEVLGEAPETGQFGGGGSRFDPGRQLVALEVSDHMPEGAQCSTSAFSSGQLARTALSWSRSPSGRASGWVRIQRVTARADGGRGPTGWGSPRSVLLT
jgi:hypothetical protein